MSKELLFSITKKDLVIDYFSGTGPGGQRKNKVQACVRIHHPQSGVIVQGTRERSKSQNEKAALKALVNHPKFKSWVRVQAAVRLQGYRDLEDKVDKMMNEKYIKVEYLGEENGSPK